MTFWRNLEIQFIRASDAFSDLRVEDTYFTKSEVKKVVSHLITLRTEIRNKLQDDKQSIFENKSYFIKLVALARRHLEHN